MSKYSSAIALGMLASIWISNPMMATSAQAAPPPSSFIVKSVAAKHASIKSLRVRTMVTAMEGEKLGTTQFKTVTYFNPQTSTLRAYALDQNNQKLYGVERKPESSTAADALLFWSNSRSMAMVLKARGIPILLEDELAAMKDEEERRNAEETFFGRWGTSVVWGIGKKAARGEAPSDPQLWVEKDSFLPQRLVARTLESSSLVDLQFEGQRYYQEFPFPKVIVAVKKKEPLLRDEVQEVAFSVDAAEWRTNLNPGFTALGEAASGELKDLIRQYFDIVR